MAKKSSLRDTSKDNQLIELLRKFDKNEFKLLGSFISSPYFNSRSEVIRFFNALKKYYPDFKITRDDFKEIHSEVYPGKVYKEVLMRKLFSLCLNCATDFLAVNSFKENKLTYNTVLLDKLREKMVPKIFEKKRKRIEQMMNDSEHTLSYYESKYKLTSIVNGYLLNVNEKSMVSRMQNELDDFEEYFLTILFILYIRLGEWSRSFNVKFDLHFFDEAIEYFGKGRTNKINLAQLYYNMLMLLTTEDEKYYFELLESRDKFEKKLSKMDDYNISIVSMQYCHKRILKGDLQYRINQFEITKKIIERDLIPPGFIEPYFFTNAVRNALHIFELDWISKFINENKSRLNPDSADEITNYSIALLEFGKKNFEQSLKLLSKINIERANMKLDIKNLQIMNFFELNYNSEIESLIDSYRHFLRRDKSITSQSRDSALIFLNMLSKLVKDLDSITTDKINTEYLKIEINNYPHFLNKEWLLKKIDEIREK